MPLFKITLSSCFGKKKVLQDLVYFTHMTSYHFIFFQCINTSIKASNIEYAHVFLLKPSFSTKWKHIHPSLTKLFKLDQFSQASTLGKKHEKKVDLRVGNKIQFLDDLTNSFKQFIGPIDIRYETMGSHQIQIGFCVCLETQGHPVSHLIIAW